MPESLDVTRLLQEWGEGDHAALDRLMPVVYEELRRLASHYLRKEQTKHGWQTTALVNEAYLRLVGAREVRWQDRAHFFAISARLIRQILVDLARQRGYQKRGGGARHVEFDEALVGEARPDQNLVALHDALEELAEFDPRKSRVVELRFFGGLSEIEIAEVLEVSPETVRRDWRLARSWLKRALSGEEPDDS